ncbi:single-stranded DNA-binding protein [Kitasatospora herbaricolor]|uniref:Single-stranded DNA-binding protein n=1 Tax=Kitasatospora herbaricolor TaxID=68217 RepID=A0ABZ1W6S9_9ACTN|nr:single-stranded DNA-binding protein [Kitasatospora herbaricolor]
MNETLVTMVGNVASVVSYAQTTGGVPVANFRLVATERRYDRAKGEWVDGDTHWVTVVAWRWLAANLVSSLSKGDPVVVSGRLRVREWEEGDRRRSGVEIDARSVGHDLSRGTSAFRWAVRGKSEQQWAGSGGLPVSGGPAGSAAGPVADGPGGGLGAGVGAGVGAGAGGGPGSIAEALAEPAVPDWIVAAVHARRASVAAAEVSAGGPVAEGEVAAV